MQDVNNTVVTFGEFNGKYALAAERLYRFWTGKELGTPEESHKLGIQLMADLGRLLAGQSASVGLQGKPDNSIVREAVKSAKVDLTSSRALVAYLYVCDIDRLMEATRKLERKWDVKSLGDMPAKLA
jgi:hypothetical protein